SAQPGCDEYFGQQYWDERPSVRVQEETTVVASGGKLALRPPHNGGVAVEGWDRNVISVIACKAATGATEQDAQRVLNSVQVKTQAGLVTADGPDDGGWTVMFRVRVPANLTIDAESHNGPLSFSGVSGTITATTTTGPISIKKCTGTITADAQNGPISLSASSGKIHVAAQNGPVSVRLNDAQWNGE